MANTLSNDSRRNSSLYQLSHTGWTTAEPVYITTRNREPRQVNRKLKMANLAFYIQAVVSKVFGLLCACLFAFILMIRAIRHPIRFISGTFFTKREAPACLKDPSLGSHGYIHLQVNISKDLNI